MAKLFINVKFSSSSSCPLEINTDSSIRELKSLISGKTGIPVADVNLIFAGKLLQNGQLVSELGLGNHTVLHAFQQKRSPLEVRAHIGLNQLSPKGPASVVHPHQFYVYCKECAALQPGKLRVVCEKCHQGKIILHQEPGSFDDVLQQGRIQGDCQNCGPQQKAKFYFKCTKDHSDLEELQGQCAVLRHIKPNRRNKECITCTDVQHPVLSFPCNKKHLICMECFLSYCVTQLNERRFVEDPGAGYSLPCPAGCPDSLIKDPHHFCLLGTEQYERYKSFAAEEYLLQNGGLMCPALGCGAGLLLEELSQKVICPSCRFEFCRECRDAYHPEEECNTHHTAGASGQEVDNSLEQAMRAHNELESMETIDKISKPCPKCRVKTERSAGCPDSLIKDPHHFCLLGTEQIKVADILFQYERHKAFLIWNNVADILFEYQRYKSFGAEEYLLQNGGLMCPALGCGAGFLLEKLSQKVI